MFCDKPKKREDAALIYVTGDLHGDMERFKSKKLKKLKKGDTLIVCGDFGFVWDGGKKEQKLLKWIGKRRYQILFVDGTHENFDRLLTMSSLSWAARPPAISAAIFPIYSVALSTKSRGKRSSPLEGEKART